jgi:hypothetical protein
MTKKIFNNAFPAIASSEAPAPNFSTSDEMQKTPQVIEYLLPFDYARIKKNLESTSTFKSKDLINKLNHINFTEGAIWIHLQHKAFKDHFLISVRPEACREDTLICLLPCSSEPVAETYACLHLIIPFDDAIIVCETAIEEMGDNAITFRLPEESGVVNERQTRRYPCLELAVDLCQNAFMAKGRLIDFSPIGLRIQLEKSSSTPLNWFNPDALVTIRVHKEDRRILSLPCRFVRRSEKPSEGMMVFAPAIENIHQFKKIKIRNPRQQINPSFEVTFKHPFTGKLVQRTVFDISTTGFSVFEKSDDCKLLPGMTISDLIIDYAGAIELKCNSTQVLYRKEHEKDKIRCGMAILDMGIKEYTDLTNIISSTFDPHTHISDRVDLDELWNFFFETGFIYPEKYKHIQDIKSVFKQTYQKLYLECPEIARHFTYKIHGKIYGHVSMVRAYERTWMFHHLSAKAVGKNLVGFIVLKHLNHFMNELCRFPSINLDYLICYFRPQNRFSNLLFGGFAKNLNNPQAASSDVFSYMLYPKIKRLITRLPDGWQLRQFVQEDFWQVDRFYKQRTNGLLVEGLNLQQKKSEGESLEHVYERGGLKRNISIYSLVRSGLLKAVLIADQTDFGFNLSNLLNGVKMIICDPEDLSWEILSIAIDQVIGVYNSEKVPILTYPKEYIDDKRLPFEQKEYVLVTLDARFYNEFIMYAKTKCKIGSWE